MNSRRPRRHDRDTVKRTWSRGWYVATLGRLACEAELNAERARAGIAPTRCDARRLIIFHQGGDALRLFRASLSSWRRKSLVREVQLLILAYCPSAALPLAVLVRSCRPAPEIVPFDEIRIDAYGASGRPDAASAIRFPSARSPINAGGSVRYGAGVPDLQRRGAISSGEEEHRRRRR